MDLARRAPRLAGAALCALTVGSASSCRSVFGFGDDFGRAIAYMNEIPQATWSPWSPDGGSLLFSNAFDDEGALQRVPIDGSEPEIVAHGSFFTPTWAPDGSAIAFGARRASGGLGPSELWTMSPDGSNRRCLVTSFAPAWFMPVWSPDGRWIAYCTETIELVRTDGSERRSLGPGVMPVWSPDSTRIAYIGSFVESSDPPIAWIHVARIDGSGAMRLTSGITPSWSPDGAQLAFVANDGAEGLSGVFAIDADGANRQRLYRGLYPRWSPRGDRILVQRADDTLVTIAPDGSDERVLAEQALFGRWSPDGAWVAFQWQWDPDLYVIRADGTDRRALRIAELMAAAEP